MFNIKDFTPKDLLGATFGSVFAHGESIFNELRHSAKTRAEDCAYDVDFLRSLVQLAGSGVSLWLINRRARAAVGFSVATTALTTGLTFVSNFTRPEKEGEKRDTRDKVAKTLLKCLPDAIATAALVFSSTTPHDLPNKLDFSPRDPSIPFTLAERARNLASLYMTYTIVGHWAEMAFCQLIRLGLVGGEYDRSNAMLWDWWLHPFPAEGVAAIVIAGALSPLREALLKKFGGHVLPAVAVSFLVNQVACTSIDYLTGMVANRNYELWDYRNMPFNFQGQICLQNSLVYTTAATLITWFAYPMREKWLRTVPSDAANMVFSASLPCYVFLSLLYFV